MKTLAFFFVLILPVSARLGETPAECTARYGAPVEISEESSMAIFQKAGFQLVFQFWKGKAAFVMITKDKAPGQVIGAYSKMSDAEMETLMLSNSGGSEWIERDDFDFVSKTYDSKDRKRIAIYDTVSHQLSFVTVEFANEKMKETVQDEKENLKEF